MDTPYPPKKIAQKCPVCNGFGTLKNGTLRCHGCDGKGWVVVDQDIQKEIGDRYEDANRPY